LLDLASSVGSLALNYAGFLSRFFFLEIVFTLKVLYLKFHNFLRNLCAAAHDLFCCLACLVVIVQFSRCILSSS